MDLPPERFGRYLLQTRLGIGGMAEVWLAVQEGPGGFSKRSVIKKILPELADSPEFVGMFLQEARLAALVNHPNVVQIFDLGEVDGTYFLVMEYVEGKSLRHLQRRASELSLAISPGVASAILAGASAGLEHAHRLRDPEGNRLSLVHRDVAPDNILVSYDGVPKLIDFGIAKAMGGHALTHPGMVKGKSGYMSPEQVRAAPLDRRADVYSLGVVLFELLSGRRPFIGSESEVLRAIVYEPPPGLDFFCPDAPQILVDLVNRCLQKDPGARPQSAAEVESVLSQVAHRTGTGIAEVADLVRKLCASDGAPPPRRTGGITDAFTDLTVPTTSLPSLSIVPGLDPPTQSQTSITQAAQTVSALPEPASWRPAILVEPPIEGEGEGGLEAEQGTHDALPGLGTLDAAGQLHVNAASRSPLPLSTASRERSFPAPLPFAPPGEPPLSLAAAIAPTLSELDTPLELDLGRAAPAFEILPPEPAPRPALPSWWPVVVVLVLALVGLEVFRRVRGVSAASDTVKLRLESKPPGAEIWVDGFPTGKSTPTTLDWDNQLPHQLMLRRPGSAETHQAVPLGQPAGTLAVELFPVGRLDVATTPPGAEIVDQGEVLGLSPKQVELLAGSSHKLTASLPDYLPATTTVLVQAGGAVAWQPVLRPAGVLSIDSDPAGVEIRVDGEQAGTAPKDVPVEANLPHLVQLSSPGLTGYTSQVTVAFRERRALRGVLRDGEERRLTAALAEVERKLARARADLEQLESHGTKEYRSAMARLRRRSELEKQVEALEGREEKLEADSASHHTAIEDRAGSR